MKDIKEGNALISEFMNVQPTKEITGEYSYSDLPSYLCIHDTYERTMQSIVNYSKYHSSWDWLMPVIMNILEICSNKDEMERYHCIIDQIPQIDHTYNSIIEFIKWYNKTK